VTSNEPGGEPRPFLAAQRRNTLSKLSAAYNRGVSSAVFEKIARSLDPEVTKIDGKGGSLDGVLSTGGAELMGPFGPPFCFHYPGLPPKSPKDLKDDKEGKEAKDSKEGKEGKEAKDSKEGKEGKEAKESKEAKDSKEGKEAKDIGEGGHGKPEIIETDDLFTRLGDPADLPVESYEAIARTHPERVTLAIERGTLF